MSSDDNDKSTEQVLEYYKKFSQNKNLPKYFSGSSVSYLPPIIVASDNVDCTENVARPTEIFSFKAIESTPKLLINDSSSSSSSPESPSEHKKLEWDNGADIGYNSARNISENKLQKSLSLPILDSLTDIRSNLNVPQPIPSTIITHSTSNENIGILVFSSSSNSNLESLKNSVRQDRVSSSSVKTESPKEHSCCIETSSSNGLVPNKVNTPSDSDETRFGAFQKSIDYLKHKIGLPGAHSTPNANIEENIKIEGDSIKPSLATLLSQNLGNRITFQERLGSKINMDCTPSGSGTCPTEVTKPNSDVQKELPRESSHPSTKRQTKHTMKKVETKIIELSISTPINVNCKDLGMTRSGKVLQTPCVHDAVTKGVQTENMTRRDIETQFNFQSKEKEHQRSETVSVSEDLADLASSFEYISVSKNRAAVKVTKDQGERTEFENRNILVNKATGISGVLKEISLSKSTTSSSSRLNYEEDIDKHLDLLQKLLKSKKMNSSSKRKYIKKLLKQLSDLETSTDSNTSSDLFIPKRGAEQEKSKLKLKPKVVFKESEDFFSLKENSSLFSNDKFQAEKKEMPTRNSDSSSESKSPDVESECLKCIEELCIASKNLKEKESIERDTSKSYGPTPEFKSTVSSKNSNGSSKTSSKTNSSEMKATVGSCNFPSNQKSSSTIYYPKQINAGKDTVLPSQHESNEGAICTCDCTCEDDSKTDQYQQLTGNIQVACPFLGQQTVVNKYLQGDVGASTTDRSSTKKDSFSKSRPTADKPSEDYLVRFAENERTYQLHWINNEISHLSKLKNILELKGREPSRSRTNVYNIVQKEGSNKPSWRNYVIETEVDVPPERVVNYVLEGKEYVVSDSQRSSSESDRAVIADIEINSNENQTNIKLCTVCSLCKQVVCICSSGKTIQSKISSLSSEVKHPTCLTCRQVVCQCKAAVESSDSNITENIDSNEASSAKADARASAHLSIWPDESTSHDSEMGVASHEGFNSLQKLFRKCSCTMESANCGCAFVKKLLYKFRSETPKVDIVNEAVQTENLCKKDRSTSVERKVADLGEARKPNQETATQAVVCNKHIGLQTLRDVLCKTTQTQSNETNEMTQVDQKVKSRDTGSCTCGNIELKDRASQSTNSGQNLATQTSRKLSKDAEVQAINLKVCCDVQTGEDAVSIVDDNLPKKSSSSSLSGGGQNNTGSSTEYVKRQARSLEVEYEPNKHMKTGEGDPRSAVSRNIEIPAYDSFEKGVAKSTQKSSEGNDVRELAEKTVSTERILSEHVGTGADYKTTSTVEKATQYSRSSETGDDSSSSHLCNNTSTSSASDSRSASTRLTCCCCKQKAFLAEVSYLRDGNDSLAVCSRCYRARYCSHNQRFSCRCWSYWCPKQTMESQQFCKCCRMEISKCPRRSKWMAYTVTLKKGGSNKKRSSKNGLDNIKVQKGWSWKSLKNKENYHMKDDNRRNGSKKGKRDMETIDEDKDNRRNGSKKGKRDMETIDEDKDDMEKDKVKKKPQKEDKNLDKEDDVHYTLMEYLIKNRPEFIYSAEYRRQMLLNSRILREQQKDGLKLNFLENNLKNSDEAKYKLYNEREMKDINRKNYKKLPEIQGKLTSQRENRLRRADRLISDVFAKKVQKSVLQGKGNFPIDKPLTSL